jgi:hypothetical protein
MRFVRAAMLLLACAAAAFVGLGGCGACKRGSPYVPFLDASNDTATVPSGDLAIEDASPDGGPKTSFAPVHATVAPAGSNKLTVEDVSIDAPPGSVILVALARDVDGDGLRDVVAYTQPPGGGGGELRFYRGDDKGGVAASKAIGGDVSMPAPCVAKVSAQTMALVGPHTVALDLRPSCGDAAPAPRRYLLATFAPFAPSIRWSARVAEAPDGWTFTIDADAIDRDGDGVDDPRLVFGLDGGGPPYEPGDRIAARLAYWDRPAGLSRDRTEPEGSFQIIAQQASARANKKATAIGVGALVRRLRLLHSAICTEGGAPWIDVSGEHGVGCNKSHALEDAGAAEVKAALTTNDVLAAIAARERLAASDTAIATKKTRADIDAKILAAAAEARATMKELRAVPATPSKGAPAWGALAFEKDGRLLVRTATGVIRIDPATMEDGEANDVSSWPWEVTVPGKDARVGGVVDACDAPYFAARISGHDVATGATLVPLPILPPLVSGRCSQGTGANAAATPVAWGASGLYTLVEHAPVIIPSELVTATGGKATGTLPAPASKPDGAYVLGAPRSPGGTWLVVPTRFGIVRRDDSGAVPVTTLVRTRELEGLYPTLHECAISDDGLHLACVREGKALLFDASKSASSSDDDAG